MHVGYFPMFFRAVSEFAKSHTIAEQRRSLPVYEVTSLRCTSSH